MKMSFTNALCDAKIRSIRANMGDADRSCRKGIQDVSAMLETVCLSNNKGVETGGEAKTTKDGVDRIRGFGLHLEHHFFPTVGEENKELIPMAKYTLHRSNFGDDGVMWSERDRGADYDATVLFISEESAYSDSYMDYVTAQRNRTFGSNNENLPLVKYDYPPKAKDVAHLNFLLKDDFHKVTGKPNYNEKYETASSKVYVFFKFKESCQKNPTGKYLFLGRFKAIASQTLGDKKKIILEYFELTPDDKRKRLLSEANYKKKISVATPVKSDTDYVISILKDKKRKDDRSKRNLESDSSESDSSGDEGDCSPSRPEQNAGQFPIRPRGLNSNRKIFRRKLQDGEIQ